MEGTTYCRIQGQVAIGGSAAEQVGLALMGWLAVGTISCKSPAVPHPPPACRRAARSALRAVNQQLSSQSQLSPALKTSACLDGGVQAEHVDLAILAHHLRGWRRSECFAGVALHGCLAPVARYAGRRLLLPSAAPPASLLLRRRQQPLLQAQLAWSTSIPNSPGQQSSCTSPRPRPGRRGWTAPGCPPSQSASWRRRRPAARVRWGSWVRGERVLGWAVHSGRCTLLAGGACGLVLGSITSSNMCAPPSPIPTHRSPSSVP